ncbi:ribosome small subunit-dependent GTPase A [Treponema endosymbiont of Eucomonympha sp.]|uniref:ribosome small subunit-dependent GTPase A n=1 Tax=Treponema endosymbiont of Eucomonympha sp. TaxID=1580831 RepID=UPI0013968AFC|nr:ribosome small subunit-dependent GTPase A [Treponema endosymbiont of Eucomonympha sp.]
MTGTVLCGSSNAFAVECADGRVLRCTIKGKRLKEERHYYNPLAPGDEVKLEADDACGAGRITALGARRNVFVRWNLKGRAPQALAANLDYALIVTAPDEPPFRPRFVDRALIQAAHDGISPAVVVNKCDLPVSAECAVYLRIWESLGIRVVRLSARTDEGLDALSALMTGKRSALVGQSGVGKSSIVNALDSVCAQRVGALSAKYRRGAHTTAQGVLLHLKLGDGSASAVDTPGVRRFLLHGVEAGEAALYFPEIKPRVGKCAFGMSCSHVREAGCAVRAAVRTGAVSAERYDSWLRLYRGLSGVSRAERETRAPRETLGGHQGRRLVGTKGDAW